MIRRPAESATAIVVLALGIGLAATGWAVVWGTYLRPVPVPDGGQLVRVAVVDSRQSDGLSTLGFDAFRLLQQEQGGLRNLDRLEAWTALGYDVSGLPGPPVRVPGAAVTAGLLRLTGVEPIEGRLLDEQDEMSGAQVAVVSEDFWRQSLNAEPVAAGDLSFVVYGLSYTVVGVLPSGLRFPYGQDLWMPARDDDLGYHWMQVLARLPEGTEPTAAAAEIEATLAHLPLEGDATVDGRRRIAVEPLRDTYHDDGIRTAILAAAGASVGILLLACANVANLLLARGLQRRREMAVRASLGARKNQLVGQLLAETSVLAMTGGLGGLLLCRVGIHFWHMYSADIGTPYWSAVRIDSQVLWMVAGLVTLSCFAAGLFPAWRQAGDEAPAATAGGHETGRRNADRWLVAAQVAVSVALLATCTVFVRTVERLESVRDHLRRPNVFTANLSIYDRSGLDVPAHETWSDVLHEVTALPEVARAAVASHLPEDAAGWPGRAAASAGAQIEASYSVASPGLFGALGIGVLAGREFDETDLSDGDPVALIDRDLATAAFPDTPLQNVVGRKIRFGEAGPNFHEFPARTIVGVVSDLGPGTFEIGAPSATPQALLPNSQTTMTGGLLVLEMRAASPEVSQRLALAVQRAAPGHPLNRLEPLSQRLDDALTAQSSARDAFSALSVVALALAAAGLYGVLAVSVGRRRRELAVRTALGATPGDLLRRVLGSGLIMLAFGGTAGLVLAYATTRTVGSLLHGIEPWDPAALAIAVSVLLATGLAASWIPARRAATVQPAAALREE